MKLQPVYQWEDNWIANELLDEEILEHVGRRMDVDTSTWVAMLSSGQYRAFTLAQIGGPASFNVVLRTRSFGPKQRLDVAYHPGMAKVHRPEILQRIRALLDALSGDRINERQGDRELESRPEGRFIRLMDGRALARWALQMDLDFDEMVRADPTLRVDVLLSEREHPLGAVVSRLDGQGNNSVVAWAVPGGREPSLTVRRKMMAHLGIDSLSVPPGAIPTDHVPDELFFTVGTP
jgi:hypothetical protein